MICASVVNLLAELQSALESRDFDEAREILFPRYSPFDWRNEGHEQHECAGVLLDAVESLSALANELGEELRWSWVHRETLEGWGWPQAMCLSLYIFASLLPDAPPCRGFDHEIARRWVLEAYGVH